MYSDIILARQENNVLGRIGLGEATPFNEFSIKMEQLFDDAGSKGGQLQSAALRAPKGR